MKLRSLSKCTLADWLNNYYCIENDGKLISVKYTLLRYSLLLKLTLPLLLANDLYQFSVSFVVFSASV